MEATVLFITGDDEYTDKILDDRLNEGDSYVRWYGQKKNKSTDKYVLNQEEIHIWYRKAKKNKFKYLGKVKEKQVYIERCNDQNLVVDMLMQKENLKVESETEAEAYNYKAKGESCITKSKMNCFKLLGLEPRGNWCSGIMVGRWMEK